MVIICVYEISGLHNKRLLNVQGIVTVHTFGVNLTNHCLVLNKLISPQPCTQIQLPIDQYIFDFEFALALFSPQEKNASLTKQ